MTRRRLLAAAAVAAAALLARGPLHLTTWGQPVSNDDAIPLLMARHVTQGELSTILWNQPYNGTLDTYLLAPGLLAAPAHGVFRTYEALCALLLIAIAGRLAWRLAGERAGWAAALLAAVGTPYLALMAATGPTPNFLVPLLTAVPLLVAWRGAPSPWLAAAAGLVAGLAIWDSALALPALLGIGVGLLLAGARPTVPASVAFAAGLAMGASPLAIARAVGASASSPVTAIRPRWLWLDGMSDLAHAAAGLFGAQVPLVVDGPQRAALPWGLGIVLAVALVAAVAIGGWRRSAWPLLAWGAALCAAFASSRRTGADEVRYLYGLALPVLALAGAGLARVTSRPLAGVLAVAIVGPWLVGHQLVRAAWRDVSHAERVWEVPTLEPVLDTLQRANVASAYASLQFAGRLALESEERLHVSQAWNERIPGDPLRFRDEVDLDPNVAWVLSSRLSRGMPRAGGFRDLMQQLGGRWREDAPADFVVFRQFVPPFNESQPVPRDLSELRTLDGAPLPAAVRDRDPGTVWTSPQGIARGSGIEARLVAAPRRLSALVLTVDLNESPLGVPWIAEVDGVVEARGPMRHTLQWVNGAPRAGKQALLTIPLGDRMGSSVRLIFQGAGPVLRIGEVFLYGPDEPSLYGPSMEFEPPRPATLAAEQALASARAGDWDAAAASYAEAVRHEPERASLHACLLRARWRAAGRRVLDVESLDDGGPELVVPAR